ncbi:hypothetical protein MUK42_36810 [Musa troglodytarum]|uniref:Uncharacterized protein n=1 Tax=Musa troglodytarum TaxID=320322 RepID=A0A9E7EH30_9LILI|nr:hypothetical protein MUK42_36810 [Musa troglodytarum]
MGYTEADILAFAEQHWTVIIIDNWRQSVIYAVDHMDLPVPNSDDPSPTSTVEKEATCAGP